MSTDENVTQRTEKASIVADDSPRPRVPASPRPAAPAAPRRFSTHVAWTFAARLLMIANSLVVGMIVARLLGAEGFGALAVINVAVAVALQIGSAGLPSANIYFIARDTKSAGSVWANSLIFAAAAGCALACGLLTLAALFPSLFGGIPPRILAVAAASVPFQLVTLLGLNFFLGVGRVGAFNLWDAAAQSFVLVNAVVALVALRAGLLALVALNSAASVVVSLLIALVIRRALIERKPTQARRADWQLFKRMVRYGLKFHVSTMAALLIVRADLLVVNYFRGEAEAGVYAVASQAALMLMVLPGVVGTLLFPRVAAERDSSGELTMRMTRHTAFVMLVVCLAAVPASFALPFVYGAPFADATVQLLILLPGVYLVGVESVLVQHFTGTGLPAAVPFFWLVALVLNVGLNVMFVPAYGARAAAVSSTLSYALIFVLVAALFRARTNNNLSSTLLLRPKELRALLAGAPRGDSAP